MAAQIDVWVLEENTRARGMYERRGWRIVPGRTGANDVPTIIDVLYERAVATRQNGPTPSFSAKPDV